MTCAIFRSAFVFTVVLLLASSGTTGAQEQSSPDRRPAFQFALTPEKIRDVHITEEAPGRFIATITLIDAQKKALAELTGKNVGQNLEVSIAGEAVLHQEIRTAMEEISLGPWMNEGLANLFAKCVTKCGPKKCL
jgi:hypothetical protein